MAINALSSSSSLKLNFAPNFRSEKNGITNAGQDTLELSAKQNNKKEGMSKGLKLLLGIGGTGLALYGAMVTHRAISRPSLEALQKDFSEIFRRDVTKEEIPDMLAKYKEILKINDEKEFCQKAFEQVKKDYGYANLDIQLTLNESTEGILGGGWHSSGAGFFIFYKNLIKHCGGKFDKLTKAKFIDTFFHEFQHVKQTEYCMRTNPEKYLQALSDDETVNKNYIKGLKLILEDETVQQQTALMKNMTVEQLKEQAKLELEILETQGYKAMPEYVEALNQERTQIKQRLNQLFGKFEKFRPESEEFKQGEKYIENYKNYIEAEEDLIRYETQLIEKEAKHAGDLSQDIPKRLRSLWNVFD